MKNFGKLWVFSMLGMAVSNLFRDNGLLAIRFGGHLLIEKFFHWNIRSLGIASTWLYIAQGYVSEVRVSRETGWLEAFPKWADTVRTSISTIWEKIFCLCYPCYFGKNIPGNFYCTKGWVFWYAALDYCLGLHWKQKHSFSRLSLPRIHFIQIKNKIQRCS